MSPAQRADRAPRSRPVIVQPPAEVSATENAVACFVLVALMLGMGVAAFVGVIV